MDIIGNSKADYEVVIKNSQGRFSCEKKKFEFNGASELEAKTWWKLFTDIILEDYKPFEEVTFTRYSIEGVTVLSKLC